MDETVQQLEVQIDRSRERLGSHLRELEARVEAATDWREHVRHRPLAALGTALAGGVLLAQVLGRPRRRRRAVPATFPPPPAASTMTSRTSLRAIDVRGQANELWENVANALIAVAAGRVTGYLGSLVPGFADEFARTRRPSRPA